MDAAAHVSQVYFVVMRNFLPVRTWLSFDLKGATANRRALAARFLHEVHAAADPATGSAACSKPAVLTAAEPAQPPTAQAPSRWRTAALWVPAMGSSAVLRPRGPRSATLEPS